MQKEFKIFLGLLPPQCNKQKLLKFLRSFGHVISLQLVYDKKTKLCKGFGNVRMGNRNAFEAVLNSSIMYEGRELFKEPFFSGKKLQKKTTDFIMRRIFVSNVPKEMADWELKEIFQRFGEVQKAYRIIASDGTKRPFGFVLFKTTESAQRCDTASRIKYKSQQIFCRFFKKKSKILKKRKSDHQFENKKRFKRKKESNYRKKHQENEGSNSDYRRSCGIHPIPQNYVKGQIFEQEGYQKDLLEAAQCLGIFELNKALSRYGKQLPHHIRGEVLEEIHYNHRPSNLRITQQKQEYGFYTKTRTMEVYWK